MWRRTGAAAAALLVSSAACAADMVPSRTFGDALSPYVGAGAFTVHHTGYDRDSLSSLEDWRFGGKLFGGLRFAPGVPRVPWVAVEFEYFYLGESAFQFGRGTEHSQAVAASLLVMSEQLFPWYDWARHMPMRLYARAGATYKFITEERPFLPDQEESGPGAIVGGGLEIDLTPSIFARVEYEFLTKIGTEHAVNVQHTPISVSVGFRF